jgi:hypothetical protein
VETGTKNNISNSADQAKSLLKKEKKKISHGFNLTK